jgi:hypothetical protein
MDSKYVPPYLRNKKETAKVVPVVEQVVSEDNFPSLGNGVASTKVFDQPSGQSFASLATSWAKDAERVKRADDLKKQYDDYHNHLHKHPTVSLPKFHNVRHFVEPEDDDEEVENAKPSIVNNEDEGWVEVRQKKKARRPKTFEEKMARPPSPDDQSKDDTVWNGDDEESYWK